MRLQQRLTFFYKAINGEVVVTTDDLGLEVADIRTRAAHCHKFKEKRARTNLLKYSMVHRTIPVWNSLPAVAVAEAGSLDIFKSRLIGHTGVMSTALCRVLTRTRTYLPSLTAGTELILLGD